MTVDNILVTKRDGRKEVLNYEKIHKVLNWAAADLNNISISQVEINANLHFYNGIATKDIHLTLIKSAADLISVKNPDYQYFAARLLLYHLRKEAFGDYDVPDLLTHIKLLIKKGFYDEEILNFYSEDEINEFNHYIDYERDDLLTYASVMQMSTKYLMQDRVNKVILECPQQLFILIPMYLFGKHYNKQQRMKYVKDFYDALSTFKISLPTPIMGGVRSPIKQFSSCCLIESGDSLDSINAVSNAIVKYVSKRAGIGINAGAIRSVGSKIRAGNAIHTGNIPFFKLFNAAVHSCSQGGLRNGAATLFYPIWTYELPELLVLKNNRGIEENRIRTMDYGVQINKYFYEKLTSGGVISLFSPSEVPGLYEAFFQDHGKFIELYEAAELNPNVRKRQLPAIEIFSLLMQERASTGRIYIQHVDHCNEHGPFDETVAPIKQSNLCMEVLLPTKPLSVENPSDGEMALCTLGAFNVGAIDDFREYERLADIMVRALDNLLDYQDYPIEAARKSAMGRRSLGIGVINYAYFLAKNNTSYSDKTKGNDLTFKLFETIQYNLLKASNALAKEKGSCTLFKETKYSKGLLPFEWAKAEAKKLHSCNLELDWEDLRNNIKKYGLRNSTLTSLMPSESSSIVSNSTNGIEPPRGYMTVKQSKDMIIKQLVPDIDKSEKYELLWDIPDNSGYLEKAAIAQIFVDQSISVNTNYNPLMYSNNKVPLNIMLQDLALAYKYGIKTLYYHNTKDGAGEDLSDECSSGACKI